jgi:hypothetical protein
MSNHATATILVKDALDRAIATQENLFILAVLLEDCQEKPFPVGRWPADWQ